MAYAQYPQLRALVGGPLTGQDLAIVTGRIKPPELRKSAAAVPRSVWAELRDEGGR